MFGTRCTAERCGKGNRVTVELEQYVNYVCHCYRRIDGLACSVVTDKTYPNRVAHSLISKVFDQFESKFGNEWSKINKDTQLKFNKLDEFIKEYQNPEEADKMLKLEKNLEEIKDIVNQTLEDVCINII